MARFNYKKFEKDSYKLDKDRLIQLYLWLHTDEPNKNGMSYYEKYKTKIIIADILTNKYDVAMGEVIGNYNGIH